VVETEVTGLLNVGEVILGSDAFDDAVCGEETSGLGNGCVSYEQLSDTSYYYPLGFSWGKKTPKSMKMLLQQQE